MVGDYDQDLWNAFHFPPGNKHHSDDENLTKYLGNLDVPDWVADFKASLQLRETNLAPSTKPLLCRPYSPFALHMALDTIAKYRELSNANATDLPDILRKYLGHTSHVAPKDAKSLALMLLGIRMHVLADTWAHQDFSGVASKEINGAGTLNYVYATKENQQILEGTNWKGTLWVFSEDTDCAAAPNAPGSAACRGHGQMGHFPDYSWQKFVYPAAWLKDGGYLLRDNPLQYKQAWYWLRCILSSCLKDEATNSEHNRNPVSVIPQGIKTCIDTYHQLDDSKLFAVGESEQLWRKTALAAELNENRRWNNNSGSFNDTQRQLLGVIDGLPTTRYGTVNISQNSILHLMELASAIHFNWCVEWAREHPEFQWSPNPKG